jgi:gas vesicle protein
MGLGAIIALLFAPRSGEETREYIRERADEGLDYMKRQTRELRERADQLSERGKEFVAKQRESLEAAVDAGKQAYRDEKRKV